MALKGNQLLLVPVTKPNFAMMRKLAFLFPFVFSSAGVVADDAFNPRKVIDRPFDPIVSPEIATAKEADGVMVKDEELVLGVVVGEAARAYPINTLTGPRREIINDVLGGRSIAATW